MNKKEDSLINSKFKRIAFKVEIFCYIINVFTGTLDQFNAS